ncbi:MAG: beta-lactamase family protein [Crocinitomicaceae bacterium]|nr:beta-lactamase family protein [Crocinitomicaceae bacterium]
MRFLNTCFVFCFVSEIFATPDTTLVQNYLNDQIDNKNVFGVQISFQQNDFLWNTSAGNLKPEDPIFIASTTKLFISAITLKYISDGILKFSDPIKNYLPEEIMNNLHTFNSQDFADSITIQHLLAHTSGLPDYFGDKPVGKNTSLMEDLFEGKDMEWTAEYAIELSKTMAPHFAPGTPEKAYYSDTNFQLLSKILEKISGKKIADLLKEKITQPLGMKSTYMYTSKEDTTATLFYYKKEHLKIPLAMTSFGADGGMVSTGSDMLKFLNAFFEGTYFPKEKISELYVWNKIMFPLNNGIGMMMAKFPGTPMFIGHSGHSGAFAFYVPDKKLYVAGTVNQVDKPETSFKMLAKMMRFF